MLVPFTTTTIIIITSEGEYSFHLLRGYKHEPDRYGSSPRGPSSQRSVQC